MKNLIATIVAATFALVGCASDGKVGLNDCKEVDWYKYGFRDGSAHAARSNLERYEQDCAASGVKPDAAAYNKGLAAGIAEFRNRRNF